MLQALPKIEDMNKLDLRMLCSPEVRKGSTISVRLMVDYFTTNFRRKAGEMPEDMLANRISISLHRLCRSGHLSLTTNGDFRVTKIGQSVGLQAFALAQRVGTSHRLYSIVYRRPANGV